MIVHETGEVHKGSPSQMFFKMQLAFLKISRYSQENTCWSRACNFIIYVLYIYIWEDWKENLSYETIFFLRKF